jgi:hypothetical protein
MTADLLQVPSYYSFFCTCISTIGGFEIYLYFIEGVVMPTKRTHLNANYGYPAPTTTQSANPIIQVRNPAGTDQAEIGQLWINTRTNVAYILVSVVAGVSTWATAPTALGPVANLTVNPGDIDVTAGDINIALGDLNVVTGNANINGTLTSGAATIVGNSTLNGNFDLTGDFTVGGNVAITGDFDLTNAASTLIRSTNNAADSIVIQSTGGVLAQQLYQNTLGTNAAAIEIDATAGGVLIQGGLATANAIHLDSTNVAGGITVDAGTAGFTLTATNGDIDLEATGAGTITLTGTTAVVGDFTVTGDFDINDAASIGLTSSNNAAGAITLLTNGGAAATQLYSNTLGTAANSLGMVSTLGGVRLQAGLASATALDLQATNAAGGVRVLAGTAGIALTAVNGPIALDSGTGLIDVGTTATVKTINIGGGAAVVETINVGGTGANVIAIGNTQAAGSVSIGSGMIAGTISIGGTGAQVGTINIAPSTAAMILNIANTNGKKTINIGNGVTGNDIAVGNGINVAAQTVSIANGASAANSTVNILSGIATAGVQVLNLAGGASNKIVNIANDAAINSVEIGAGAVDATITIGSTAGTNTIDLGVSLATSTVTVGSVAAASSTLIQAGTGDLILTSLDELTLDATGPLAINSVSTISIGNDANAQQINIGTGAAARPITLGNAVGTTSVDIVAASGGITFTSNGDVRPIPNTVNGVVAGAGVWTATSNHRVARIAITNDAIAGAGLAQLTVTNSIAVPATGLLISAVVLDTSGNHAAFSVDGSYIVAGGGSFVVNLRNSTGNNFAAGDTVYISFWLLN